MANLGKCPDCPAGTHERILIGGKCPYHWNNPVVKKTAGTVKDLVESGIKTAEKEIKKLKAEILPFIPKKPRKPIKKASKKLAKANGEYSLLRRSFMAENRMCKATREGCTIHATEVHHKQGRGKNLLLVETWLPVCHNCHEWITINSAEAMSLGLSIRRNGKA